MPGKRLSTGLLALFLLLFGWAPATAAQFGYQGTHILTHGALEELARAFHRKTGLPLIVKGGGCRDGIAVVTKDRYQMGGICCPLDRATSDKYGLVTHRVAVDIKAALVNRQNPLTDLSLKQIAAIHRGEITNWQEVGGPDRPIALVFRDHCREMAEPVRTVLGLSGPLAAKAIIVNTDQEIIDYVEKFPAALGVVSKVLSVGAAVKTLRVDGREASPAEVEAGRYPLVGDLAILTKGQPSGFTRDFIDFVLSPEGQAIIGRNFGRVKISPP